MVNYLEVKPTDIVLEIGPGEGMLTKELIDTGANIISVEIDYSLLPNLIKKFSKYNNFHLEHGDTLTLNIQKTIQKHINLSECSKYKVIGSLPFNTSKKIISIFFHEFKRWIKNEISLGPTKMVFLLQEEVSKLYNCSPPHMTYLSAISKIYSVIKKYESVPNSQFFPTPKVNGGIISFTFKENIDFSNNHQLEKIIKLGFQSPRKTLVNNLKQYYPNINEIFKKLNLDNKVRAAALSLNQWGLLSNELNKNLKHDL